MLSFMQLTLHSFIKNKDSAIELLSTFHKFSSYPEWNRINRNAKLQEKYSERVLCGNKYLNLENKAIKAVGYHYSYNIKSRRREKFWIQRCKI